MWGLRRLSRRPPGNRTQVAGAEAQMHAPAPTVPQGKPGITEKSGTMAGTEEFREMHCLEISTKLCSQISLVCLSHSKTQDDGLEAKIVRLSHWHTFISNFSSCTLVILSCFAFMQGHHHKKKPSAGPTTGSEACEGASSRTHKSIQIDNNSCHLFTAVTADSFCCSCCSQAPPSSAGTAHTSGLT